MIPWMENGQKRKIAVIGDMILDEYLAGDVCRISPEAPVPVHLVRRTTHAAGGAGNSALNLAQCGAQVSVFGVWGDDEPARLLGEILQGGGADTSGIISLQDRPTIRKTRVTAGSQQLLRLDWELASAIPSRVQAQLFERFAAGYYDAVLISDYGKGVLSRAFLAQVFRHCKVRKVPVVVDPKGVDFHRYQGCSLLTPNLKEACNALGVQVPADGLGQAFDMAGQLQDKFGLSSVLVTMGARGMLLRPGPGHDEAAKGPFYEAPRAREVFDVSGAGDTVAAIMTLCQASGAGYQQAIHLANIAAGLVVEKWGTQPVSLDELSEGIRAAGGSSGSDYSRQRPFAGTACKRLTQDTASKLLKERRDAGDRIVFTNGCFDILHAGHLSYLEKARALGDCLVIGLNTDASVRALKGPSRPVVPLEQRAILLAGLSCVDYVIPFAEKTPERLIRFVRPDILAKGADYTEDNIVGADFVRECGGQVHCLPLWEGLSTSAVLRTLSSFEL